MEAAGGLQRSEISFRRTGSSGLVWDDKFLGELAKIKPASASSQDPTDEPRRNSSATAASADPPATLQRSRSEGGRQGYKPVKDPSPSVDPPSPKVGCAGICSIFSAEKQPRSKRAKRRV